MTCQSESWLLLIVMMLTVWKGWSLTNVVCLSH